MRKIVFSLFAILVLFSLSSSAVSAQGYIDKKPEEFGAALDAGRKGEVNKEGWVFDTISDTMQSGNCFIIGFGCTAQTENAFNYMNRSAVGSIASLIGGIYSQPPASFSQYARDLWQNAGFAPKAYAQGIGYSGLQAIFPLWKVTRNASYILITAVLIFVGFLMIFRVKINPQTVVSIQEALPRVITTLLLITFSYAIAGLLIDLTYIAIFLVTALLASAIPGANVLTLQESYVNANLGSLFDIMLFNAAVLRDLPMALFGQIALGAVGTTVGSLIGSALLIGTSASVLLPAGAIGAVAGLVLPVLIIALSVFFAIIRLFFLFLSSYIQIILAIVFGPLQLLLGVVPGQNSFSGWLKNLIGNLIIFPAFAGILTLSTVLTAAFAKNQTPLWAPPFLTGASASPKLIASLISVGLYLVAPALLTQLKSRFAGKGAGIPLSPAIFFASGTSIGRTALTASSSYFALTGSQIGKTLKDRFTKPKGP